MENELELNIVQRIREHVENRNPKYACLVTPAIKLRELGYLNRSNIEELLIFIKKFVPKLVINLEVELVDQNKINHLTINDLIKKAQFCVCVK